MDGVVLNDLRQIDHPYGAIYHGLKRSDSGFNGFGEAYFSFVDYGAVKGWKKHREMYLNLLVPVGEIEFVIYDDREKSQTKGGFYVATISKDNYQRLTVSPGLWVAFRGCKEGKNMLLNVASIEHDPCESVNVGLGEIPYDW